MYPAAEAANRSAALLLRCTALRFPSPMCTGLRHVRGQGRKRGRGMRTRPGEAFSAPPPARRWRFSLAPSGLTKHRGGGSTVPLFWQGY